MIIIITVIITTHFDLLKYYFITIFSHYFNLITFWRGVFYFYSTTVVTGYFADGIIHQYSDCQITSSIQYIHTC